MGMPRGYRSENDTIGPLYNLGNRRAKRVTFCSWLNPNSIKILVHVITPDNQDWTYNGPFVAVSSGSKWRYWTSKSRV